MTQDHGTTGGPHIHSAREILAYLPDSPIKRDIEVCACGAQRLVDVPGKPAGQWTQMKPIPYANPIGHVDGVAPDGGIDFTLMDAKNPSGLHVGALVTVLRYSPKAGAIARVQGVITKEGTLNGEEGTTARFRVIRSEPGQESPPRRGNPVYLEDDRNPEND